jgi:hypothetical protein
MLSASGSFVGTNPRRSAWILFRVPAQPHHARANHAARVVDREGYDFEPEDDKIVKIDERSHRPELELAAESLARGIFYRRDRPRRF